MQNRDGTGLKGRVPFGERQGHFILKTPNGLEEPATGFTGKEGRPIRFFLMKAKRGYRERTDNRRAFISMGQTEYHKPTFCFHLPGPNRRATTRLAVCIVQPFR
jgi:hypothetical protein